ncbi:MAG: LysM peptidoglycan-binding domain-containing protein [Pseudomonadota bacterium]
MSLAVKTRAKRTLIFAAAAGLVAGCSLNPFGGKKEESIPVSRAGQAATQPVSLGSTNTRRAVDNAPRVTPVETVPIADGAPDQYVVKRGDTLWDISQTFLRDPWYWPEIWQVNPQIENPHLIYPGDLLSLIYVDGQPRILLERGAGRNARLSPGVRVIPLEEAITTIPYEAIAAFLTRAAVIERDQLETLPYVLKSRGDHLISSAGVDLYARGDIDVVGSRYSVVHINGELRDPDNNDVVGYDALYVGDGTIRRGGDPATLFVNESQREILTGDRLINQDVVIPLNFFPKPPSQAVEGEIISVIDGVSRIGQFQVVVINRGESHGLESGDVLTVLQRGDVIYDRIGDSGVFGAEQVKLPDEEAGTMMVFKTYDRISYGLIMSAENEIQVADLVRDPR